MTNLKGGTIEVLRSLSGYFPENAVNAEKKNKISSFNSPSLSHPSLTNWPSKQRREPFFFPIQTNSQNPPKKLKWGCLVQSSGSTRRFQPTMIFWHFLSLPSSSPQCGISSTPLYSRYCFSCWSFLQVKLMCFYAFTFYLKGNKKK